MVRAVRIVVSGIVQGVGYRHWTTKRAAELKLNGFVRNLYDGRVQIHAEGEAKNVETLIAQCHEGPRYAEVTSVVHEVVNSTDATRFAVRKTADLTSI